MKFRLAILLLAMTLGFTFTAGADSAPVPWTAPQDAIQMSKDSSYIYFRQPVHLLMDHGQKEALKKAATFVSAQLAKVAAQYSPQVDPNGDLQAIVQQVQGFQRQVNQLVDVASTVYGSVDAERSKWLSWLGNEADPTGFILFGTLETTKNLLNWVPIPYISSIIQGGGSITAGVVFVPMAVTRIPLDGGPAESYTDFDWSIVVIPNANAGVGVTATAMDSNARLGVGIIWGQLNRASDLVGLSGGGAATLDYPEISKILPDFLQAGVNFKLLGLKNPARPGAIDNVLGLIGLEAGASPTWNGTVPLLKLKAQSHFNVSWIFDATKAFTGVTSAGGSLIRKVTGTN